MREQKPLLFLCFFKKRNREKETIIFQLSADSRWWRSNLWTGLANCSRCVCFHVKGSPDITGDLGHLRAAAMHRTALRQPVETGKRWRGTKLENKEQDSGVFSSKLSLRSQKQVQVRNQKSSRGFSCFSSVSHQPQSSHNSFAATRQFSLID